MNLGQLVRSKMKEMSADLSGEYIDKMGKHFGLSQAGDAYTVSYGGDAKREVEITKPQAMKLASNCRKLEVAEADDRKKLAADKPLNTQHWIETINKIKNYATSLSDQRMIEAQIERLDGIVAGILNGDYKNDAGVSVIADAKNKAIAEIKRSKNYSKS